MKQKIKITEGGKTYEVYDGSPGGYKSWRINGQISREEGPAWFPPAGGWQWLFNYITHREEGPAFKRNDGHVRFYLLGEFFHHEGHQSKVKEINKFYEAYSVGDIFSRNFILLGKRNPPVGKIFKVYDIKRKEIRDELVYSFVR